MEDEDKKPAATTPATPPAQERSVKVMDRRNGKSVAIFPLSGSEKITVDVEAVEQIVVDPSKAVSGEMETTVIKERTTLILQSGGKTTTLVLSNLVPAMEEGSDKSKLVAVPDGTVMLQESGSTKKLLIKNQELTDIIFLAAQGANTVMTKDGRRVVEKLTESEARALKEVVELTAARMHAVEETAKKELATGERTPRGDPKKGYGPAERLGPIYFENADVAEIKVATAKVFASSKEPSQGR